MNDLAQKENARSLAAILGVAEAQAAELLDVSALVTCDVGDCVAANCAKHISALLRRTIRGVQLNAECCVDAIAVEVIVGNAVPRSTGPLVFVSVGDETVFVSDRPCFAREGRTHPIGVLLGACYATAAALRAAIGESLPFPMPELLRLNLAELLGADLPLLYEPLHFDETYLAGAGAVGNGFIYGLSQFDVTGELHVVDDDKVGSGNLQRCILFKDEDVNAPKTDVLCSAAKVLLPKVNVIPHRVRVQDLPARRPGPWLRRLVVGVDSPRARRSLQSEVPGEVFDASTTGINEVVLHFHRQPTEGACLGCVYPHNPQEHAHEAHVADALGVSLTEVRQERISATAAMSICKRYPGLVAAELTGTAYDTLFKKLCSTLKLKTAEDRQVLAPFAFVSVLAGALLAVEFLRRIRRGHEGVFNEWRISPWSNPVLRRRRHLEKNPACDFCSDSTLAAVARRLWAPTA